MNLRATKEFMWLERRVNEVLWKPGFAEPTVGELRNQEEQSKAQEKQINFMPLQLGVSYQQQQTAAQTSFGGLMQGFSGLLGGAMSAADYNRIRGENRLEESLPYVHQEYPKALYRKGESPVMVANAAEHLDKINDGWQERPVEEE